MLLCLTLGISVILICHHFLYDYMWSHGLLWYPFIIIAPTLSLLAAKFFDLTYKVLRPFFSLISIFGKASLEILLASDFLFDNFSKLNITIFSERITSIIVVLLGIMFGIAFHYFIDFILKRMDAIILKRKRRIENA